MRRAAEGVEKVDGIERNFTGTVDSVTDIKTGGIREKDWLLYKMCDTPKFLKTLILYSIWIDHFLK